MDIKFLLINILAISCICLIAISNFNVKASSQSVVINELAWAGSTASSSDEWIELKNTTSEDTDLTGWTITKQTSSGEVFMLEILENIDEPTANTILANDYFLIANNSQDHEFSGNESVLNIEPDYIKSAVSLSNSTLHIRLYDSSDELIDEAGNGDSPFTGDNTLKASMERKDPWGNGANESYWYTATTSVNFDSDVIDLGTPKADNSPEPLNPPEIMSITPDEGQIETIWIAEEMNGNNFSLDGTTQIKLEKGDISIWASDFDIESTSKISEIRFNLFGAEVGTWDLTIINPDGQNYTLDNTVILWEEEEEPEIVLDFSDTVELTELYPNPKSSEEEFIELYNSGDNAVNLNGWKLDDKSPGGSSDYLVDNDLIIGPKQYLVFTKSQTKIALNNTGDYAQLIQPNGIVLENTPNYGNSKAGESYIKIDGSWQWTENVTKGYENKLTEAENDANTVPPAFIFGPETNIKDPWIPKIELEVTKNENGVLLFWETYLPGALGGLEIYVSEDEEDLGNRISTLSPRKNQYEVNNLDPNTDYYFQIISSFNGEDIKSNRVKVKTSNTTTKISKTIGLPGQILITELLPNPESGENEFIEIHNPTDEPVNISGWKIEDASGKSYILNSLDLSIQIQNEADTGLILEPGQYLLLDYKTTKIRLNNTGGDDVILLDGEDNIIDEVTYTETTKSGIAYVLAPNGKWFWTDEITPGMKNNISFAGVLGDSDEYLVNTGSKTNILIYWLLAIFFGIIGYRMIHYEKRI
ncbi:MAG: lamin tail domain-containing protein [Patescibacteria group bacterium]|nr:lamin tail domain-containing protein [Patescibacteria group bacterium]